MKTLLTSVFLFLAILVQGQTLDTAAIRIEIDSLITLSNTLLKDRQYDEAYQMVRTAEEKCLASFGEESLIYTAIIYAKGNTYFLKKDYLNTELYWTKAKQLRKNFTTKKHPNYEYVSMRLGLLYKIKGEYHKSEKQHLEIIQLHEKTLGKEHEDYARAIYSLGKLYYTMNKYDDTEKLYLEALNIRDKLLGEEHQDYISSLLDLGVLYWRTADYKKAEEYWLKTKNLYKKTVGNEHPKYARALNNLGILYKGMGQFEKAESMYLEAKVVREQTLGNDHPKYAGLLVNLAVFYHTIGQLEKAESMYLEAKAIFEKNKSLLNNTFYHNCLNNLGILYHDLKQFEKAESVYLDLKIIRENLLGKEHPKYSSLLINLGSLYYDAKDFQKAETLFLEALTINEKVYGKEHLDCAIIHHNLGSVNSSMRRYKRSESYYLKAKIIRENSLGKEHLDFLNTINNLGHLYWTTSQIKKAKLHFLDESRAQRSLLLKAVRHLSERELRQYIHKYNYKQSELNTFAQSKSVLIEEVYNNALFYKGFLLNATQQVNRLAEIDSTSYDLFLELKDYNRRLSNAYSLPITDRDSSSIAELEEKANTIEKELIRTVSGFGEAIKQVAWQDVQSTLRSGEAAIEFVHYDFYGPEPTDSTMYAALLLLPNHKPQLISLFEEQEINALIASHQERRSDYVNDLYANEHRGASVMGVSKKSLYELIWKPIEAHLVGVNTIYFSPSGLLHRINLAAIPLDDEQSLCDQYSLVQVNSTRQLVIPHQKTAMPTDALLMGGIEYDLGSLSIIPDMSDTLEIADLTSKGEFGFENADSTLRGGTWNYLEYTEKEVSNVAKLLSSNGFQIDVRTNKAATEEVFRQNTQGKTSPRILHLATHGFFFPDPENQQTVAEGEESAFKTSDHPMIRSGLILAGGNHVWQGNPKIKGMEDGVLTAYEISQLNLSNTELVVLSACETGLGDIEGNEGVYGLQRAFKIAGAKYLIMSLWQIPDRETKDFMVTLYEHLLEDKMSIPDAFRLTQKEMKNRFYNPYQWAGFVLVE